MRDRVDAALVAFRAAHPDAPVPPARSEVVVGDPAKELVLLSQQLGAGLVVVATRDRKGLPRAVLGSVAAEVLDRCTCPVLILKPIAHPKVAPLAEIQAPSHRPVHIHTHAYHHEGASTRAMRPWGFGF